MLVEAFATATPVVASDIPGFADVATPDDGDARAAGRRGGARGRDRRDCSPTSRGGSRWARAARALAEERYSWTDVARRLEEIYERVAA